MVYFSFPKRADYERSLYNTCHCTVICSYCNPDRHCRCDRHSGNEEKIPHDCNGNHQYSDVKCRYRDRYLIDAFIYRCRIRLKISGD